MEQIGGETRETSENYRLLKVCHDRLCDIWISNPSKPRLLTTFPFLINRVQQSEIDGAHDRGKQSHLLSVVELQTYFAIKKLKELWLQRI